MVDLGIAPPSNALISLEKLDAPERRFPLRVLVCEECWLAQTQDVVAACEMFEPEYSYLSGYSSTWISHCKEFVDRAIDELPLRPTSSVVEVAANDGTLLGYFEEAGMRCCGIEPTAAAAQLARDKGLDIVEAFLTPETAAEVVAQRGTAQLVVANNVLAHVPDINGFVTGCRLLLAGDGVATFEFQHLLRLVEESQFDTIYHEHFSYLSLGTAISVLSEAGLDVFDVEEIPTHGGSLRVYAQHSTSTKREQRLSVKDLLGHEVEKGMRGRDFYLTVQGSADRCRRDLVGFLRDAKDAKDSVVGYGAAAKGNTLLNYAGVGPDLVKYVVDRNPNKQGMFLPGSRIPVVSEDRLGIDKPEYVLILPWNLTAELKEQLAYVGDWGGSLVVAVPSLKVL